jgi:hypothetical protein
MCFVPTGARTLRRAATREARWRRRRIRRRRKKRRATTSFVTEQQRQCPSGRYWRGTGLCGCSFASNCGWIRGVWVRGDGTGASRPGAVTPRLARALAETPGRSARVGLLGLQCSAPMQRGRAAPRQLRACELVNRSDRPLADRHRIGTGAGINKESVHAKPESVCRKSAGRCVCGVLLLPRPAAVLRKHSSTAYSRSMRGGVLCSPAASVYFRNASR